MDNQFINLTLLDEQNFDVLLGFSTQLLAGILTLIIGFWLAGRAGRLTVDSLNKIERLDNTVVPLLGALVRYAGMTLTLVVALGKFGVETTSIIAVLGAAGLAIGSGVARHIVKCSGRPDAGVFTAIQNWRLDRGRRHVGVGA